ncbi:sphingolipid biosynthesis protein [Schizosaccharomyces japonicus yFS275]|uniref:Sphingolipid biosynthesis protein n=1 Tax=Schizosaccharomyces japonicus (strain yFS275 / FY16936) TaxID=402676 RepID=B6K393_SCHJY|nr:sphingolipid biosynthesis protein [Schizosaccharomyces japonicus yFS275]EEB07950.1 sphingolipid biosynthesis protein [Schizosaccharomyces japonicus yFS275]
MGVVLSLPSLVASGIASVGSIFAGLSLSTFFGLVNSVQSAFAAKLSYAALFLFNSLLSWLMLSSSVNKLLSKLTFGYLNFDCESEGKCYSVLAVHRFGFALSCFHLLLAVFTAMSASRLSMLTKIQNGLWPLKYASWLFLVVVSFFLPNQFLTFWGNYISIFASAFFILYGLLLLVDFAHSWAEKCLDRIAEEDSSSSKVILVGSTVCLFGSAIAMSLFVYAWFCSSSCVFNQVMNTINVFLCIISTCVAVHPLVQEHNPRSGLAQASTVACYTCYLIMSAVVNEPSETKCNPWSEDSLDTREVNKVLGAIFTFVAILYSTMSAASPGASSDSHDYRHLYSDSHDLSNDGEENEGLPSRQEILQRAVEEGNLLPSDLNSSNAGGYGYSFFHILFFLAACYTASVLTNWNTLRMYESSKDETFIRIGYSYAAVWVKMISSWTCHTIYVWTCIAPVIFPYRFTL